MSVPVRSWLLYGDAYIEWKLTCMTRNPSRSFAQVHMKDNIILLDTPFLRQKRKVEQARQSGRSIIITMDRSGTLNLEIPGDMDLQDALAKLVHIFRLGDRP